MASLLPFKLSLKDRLKAAFDTICMLVTDDKLHRVCEESKSSTIRDLKEVLKETFVFSRTPQPSFMTSSGSLK